MTLYSTEAQQFGLAKETVRATAESAPTKWYPTKGLAELNYALKHLNDDALRGIAAMYPPIAGRKEGSGKVAMYLDAQSAPEFFYSLLGGVSSAEETVITIDNSNKYLDFDIGGSELHATITTGSYAIGTSSATASTLCKAIKDALFAADATGTYTVTYSRSTKLFTIARSTGTLNLKWNTGTNTASSIAATIGFSTAANSTGSTSYTGTSTVNYAFKHTLTRAATIQKPSYTFFVDRGMGVLKYNLGTVRKIALKSGVDNLIEMDTDLLFKTEASGSIGSPSYPTQRYLGFQAVDFKIAGSSNTDVKDWSINIDNKAKGLPVLNASQDISDIVAPDRLTIDGGFTIYFENTTERDKFIANTSVALRMLCAGDVINGSSKWTVDINIYNARYKAFPYGEDQGLLAAKTTFEGFYSSSDSKEIQVDITNADVSY